jgi:hypothetical protein
MQRYAYPALRRSSHHNDQERVARLEVNVEHLQADVNDLKADVRNVKDKVDAVSAKVDDLKAQTETRFARIEGSRDRLATQFEGRFALRAEVLGAALQQPERLLLSERWSGAGASTFASQRIDFLEIALRLIASLALVAVSPETKLPLLFFWSGAMLAIRAIPMMFLDRSQRRQAVWAVPYAKRILPLMGIRPSRFAG